MNTVAGMKPRHKPGLSFNNDKNINMNKIEYIKLMHYNYVPTGIDLNHQ